MMFRFKDDDCKLCDQCGEVIAPGNYYQWIKKNGVVYRCCDSEKCMLGILDYLYGSEFNRSYISTAEDKEGRWADMEYDRIKDDECCREGNY